MKEIRNILMKLPLELVFWPAALMAIMFIDPSHEHHFTLCPLGLAGIEWCPGCGLGRSMKLLAMGDISASFQMHPLGGFAWAVILYRMFEIIKQLKTKRNYG
ncbi:hypothetical protein DN752_01500 [Echinicola strongylocentroti]|uniref:DUF2752 domain-containing protein n=1 Tax=Echinicola strongylocentroti TaxID=1795355 RepID=A0A2Z4ID39_9BACT|nr:DUF2752 domain-containing protein [Echinicola strongylocentroti]AWW28912.1 hypothetical protein DN752_01500 [Echinicola strongylocentroti]